MNIGVDLDGVVADFNSSYIRLIKRLVGKDLFPSGYRAKDIETWSYPETFGYTNAEINKVWDWIGQDRHFWQNLDRLEGAKDLLRWLGELNNGHRIYFITSRIGGTVKAQSESWILNNGWMFDDETPTVLISSDKGLCCRALKIDYYIDDKNENIADVLMVSPRTKAYLLNQRWNSPAAVKALVTGDCDFHSIDTLNEFKEAILGQ